jgi:hypothetical protein
VRQRSAIAFSPLDQPAASCAVQGQIVGLERRTSAVDRDTISRPDRGPDDVANAVAGAAALSKFGGYDTSLRWVSGDDDVVARTAKTPGWIL